MPFTFFRSSIVSEWIGGTVLDDRLGFGVADSGKRGELLRRGRVDVDPMLDVGVDPGSLRSKVATRERDDPLTHT